jgi:hypothetical protein
LGQSLSRIIHTFAEAEEDDKIFMAKFDIKDGFWRLDCKEGSEWNFAYVLPQHTGELTRLVILITPNGMGGIPILFLHSLRNSTQCGNMEC